MLRSSMIKDAPLIDWACVDFGWGATGQERQEYPGQQAGYTHH